MSMRWWFTGLGLVMILFVLVLASAAEGQESPVPESVSHYWGPGCQVKTEIPIGPQDEYAYGPVFPTVEEARNFVGEFAKVLEISPGAVNIRVVWKDGNPGPNPVDSRFLIAPTPIPELRYHLAINGVRIATGQTSVKIENATVEIHPAPEKADGYTYGVGVTVRVSPDKADSYGIKFSGDCSATPPDKPCEVILDRDRSVRVEALDWPSLHIHDAANSEVTARIVVDGGMSIAGGFIKIDPPSNGGNYAFDQEVTLSIPNAYREQFASWGKACSGAIGYECVLIMDVDKTAGVYFHGVSSGGDSSSPSTPLPSPTPEPTPELTPMPETPPSVALANSSGDIALALQVSPKPMPSAPISQPTAPPASQMAPPKTLGELIRLINASARSDKFQRILSTLKESYGIVPGIPDDFLFDPKKTLSYGMQNPDVWKFQRFLNLYSKCRVAPLGEPGSFGMETTYYGRATESAAKCFQETYRGEILAPLGLVEGTGIAAEFTLTKVNSLLKETRARAVTPPMVPVNLTYTNVQFNMSGVANFHGWGSPGSIVYLYAVDGPCRESFAEKPTVAEVSCTVQVNSGGYWQIDNVPIRPGKNTFFMGSNWRNNDPCDCFSGWGPQDTFLRAHLLDQLYMSLAEEVVNTQVARILTGDTKTLQEHAIRMGLDFVILGDALDVGQQAMLLVLGDEDADPLIGSLALLGIATTITGPSGDGLVSGAKVVVKTSRHLKKLSPMIGKNFEEAGLQIFTSISIRNLDEIPGKAKELKQLANLGLNLLDNPNLATYEKLMGNPQDTWRLAKYPCQMI